MSSSTRAYLMIFESIQKRKHRSYQNEIFQVFYAVSKGFTWKRRLLMISRVAMRCWLCLLIHTYRVAYRAECWDFLEKLVGIFEILLLKMSLPYEFTSFIKEISNYWFIRKSIMTKMVQRKFSNEFHRYAARINKTGKAYIFRWEIQSLMYSV